MAKKAPAKAAPKAKAAASKAKAAPKAKAAAKPAAKKAKAPKAPAKANGKDGSRRGSVLDDDVSKSLAEGANKLTDEYKPTKALVIAPKKKKDLLDRLNNFVDEKTDEIISDTRAFFDKVKGSISKSRKKAKQSITKRQEMVKSAMEEVKDDYRKVKGRVMHTVANFAPIKHAVDRLVHYRSNLLPGATTSAPATLTSKPEEEEDEEVCRIYVDMVGDMFHYGHMQALRNARRAAEDQGKKPHLIVGLCSDEEVASYKRKPILNLEERCKAVMGCRYVDEVLPACPMQIDEDTMHKHKIDLVVHGDDFTPEQCYYYYKVPIDMGKFQTVPYTPSISTTDLINRCAAYAGHKKIEAKSATPTKAAKEAVAKTKKK